MSGKNIVDDTFGDISRFQAFRRSLEPNFQNPGENDSGEQFELTYTRGTSEEAINDAREIDSSPIESELSKWSGPDTLSDQDSWGALDSNGNGSEADIRAGQVIADVNGTVYSESISVKKDSSSYLVDETFEEIDLVDQVAQSADIVQPYENVTNKDNNLVDENIENVEKSSEDGSPQNSDSNSVSKEVHRNDGNNKHIQDSDNNFVNEFIEDADNNMIDERNRLEVSNPDLNGDVINAENESIGSTLMHGSLQDVDDHSANTDIQDSDSDIPDDHVGNSPRDIRFKNQNKRVNIGKKSNKVVPIEDPTPRATVENSRDVSINIEDEIGIRDEDRTEEWTVLEVWSCFAMIAGGLPYWISNDGHETILHKTILSKSFWAFSLILYVIEILNVIPKMSENFSVKPTGPILCLLAKYFSYALFLLLSIWTSVFKEQNLIKANNRILSLPFGRLSKRNAAKLFAVLFLFAVMNTCCYILYQAKYFSGFGIVDRNEVMETLECYGKMPLTLSTTCAPSDFLSIGNIIWGLFGVILTTHEIFIKTTISLGVLISCGILLYATFDFNGMEAYQGENLFSQVTKANLNDITNLAEDMSRFIGEVLTGYLIMNATASTDIFYHVSLGGILVFISGIFNNVIILIGMLLGSVAALRINWIVDEISSRDHNHPDNGRPGTAMVMNFLRDMAFRKSTGIGLSGIFVMNFKTSFSYVGAIGALIVLRL